LAAAELFSPYEGIHFAGTETADQWRGFAEGALQSAERAVSEMHAV
jgi:monoamine oxidase